MSGHSKWSTIKRKKGAEDAKRGKIFTRLAREITIAAKESGGDESTNPKLKLAVQKAKDSNMPKDNIARAIKKGTGELAGGDIEEITYEAYGPDGVAFLIDVVTDNKNRSLADVKYVFNRSGGSMASAGAVQWQFEQKGYITILKEDDEGEPVDIDFEEVFMVAAEAGADDVADAEDMVVIYTPRDMFGAVEQAVRNAGYKTDEAELRWEPQNETELPVDKAVKNMKIVEQLEELDDVDAVSSNLMITDEIALAFETD
jgi:YebC/PmpR family DNA-binding regulatory protein